MMRSMNARIAALQAAWTEVQAATRALAAAAAPSAGGAMSGRAGYSLRSASRGSRCAALRAGRMPAARPMATATASASSA